MPTTLPDRPDRVHDAHHAVITRGLAGLTDGRNWPAPAASRVCSLAMSTPTSRGSWWSWRAALAVGVVAIAPGLAPTAARAEPPATEPDPYQLGAFFGPRVFSDTSSLGEKDDYRTSLDTSVAFGVRLARPVLSWLVPELEVPFSVTTTTDANDVTVAWFDPRVLVRFVPLPRQKVRPFVVFGAGVPITMSTKRGIFGSDVSYDAFGGIGAQASPGRGLHFRVDVRVGLTDGVNEEEVSPVALEAEVSVGFWVDLGGGRGKARGKKAIAVAAPTDADGDGFADGDDRCPDRAEDADGFEDRDGCPDIDNDLDRVLDIADGCASVPETFNGFDDEDGCPDTVPQDLDDALGTIEGLIYPEGGVDVADAAGKALDKAAELLTKYRGVRVLIIGHTDDREVTLPPIDPDDLDPPDEEARAAQLAEALVALSVTRAEGVRDALIARGITRGRIVVIGKGAEDPVSDNDTPRGRRSNRRVETKLYVPER